MPPAKNAGHTGKYQFVNPAHATTVTVKKVGSDREINAINSPKSLTEKVALYSVENRLSSRRATI